MKITHRAILFDAGGTLIARQPADDQVFLQRLHVIGLNSDLPAIHKALKQSGVWIGEQILREINGAPRMPHDEFMRKVDEVALRAIFSRTTDGEAAIWLESLQALPEVRQSWKPSPGERYSHHGARRL
jgi:hypothetical protein